MLGAVAGAGVAAACGHGPTPACNYTVSVSSATLSAAGGQGAAVIAPAPSTPGCGWSVTSDASWLTLSGETRGTTEPETVSYTAAPNPGVAPRVATLQVTWSDGKTEGAGSATVTQPGAACSVSVTPDSQSVAGSGGNVTALVTASCAWTASTDVAWLTITSGTSGGGTATMTAAADANAGGARTGHITVAAIGSAATFTVTQAPPTNAIQLTPGVQDVSAAGGSFSVAVAAPVAWTATSDASWLTITSGASSTTNGAVAYSVASNSGAARTAHVVVSGEGATATLVVNQSAIPSAPANCSVTVSPDTQAFSSDAASSTTAVTSSCPWTAVSDSPWLTISSGAAGNGNGVVAYAASLNSGATRTGHITIAVQGASATLTVNQDAAPQVTCTLSVGSPTLTVPAQTSGYSSAVSSNCSWSTTSDVTWLTLTAGSTGSGNGQVDFTVAANTGAARTGHLTLTATGISATITVTQGVPFIFSPTQQTVAGAGQSGLTAALTATGGWTVDVGSTSWVTITSASSGTGNATVTYTVTPNNFTARVGKITAVSSAVLGVGLPSQAILTISQGACPFSPLNPMNQNVPAGGAGGLHTDVTTSCIGQWTAAVGSGTPWLTISAGSQGSGNGSVVYSVAANATGLQRTGTITVTSVGGTSQLTVTQDP